jgi:superfamily I DNA/RNA helicase
MPRGKFPPVRKPRPDEPPPDPADESEKMKAERNLAYVALTRAAVNLEVLCPMVSGSMQAGISPFVFEAGLKVGENVPKGEVFESGEKTAAVESVDPYVIETLERFADEIPVASYDRRGP